MYFQFLIEDRSGKELVEQIMKKIVVDYPQVLYRCKGFQGIGGFTKKNTVKETKDGKLLNDLATMLRGFNKSLQGIPAAVVIVMDNDDRDTEAFLKELKNVALQNRITMDHVFCIAVEEMEAWLLGDKDALLAAYPSARVSALRDYEQGSICGTWEVLAETVYPGGLAKFKKECPSYMEAGLRKSEWARNIGVYMNLDKNQSPSFNYFLNQIRERLSA